MRILTAVTAVLLGLAEVAFSQSKSSDEFTRTVRPVLVQNCSRCHNAANPRNPANFLKAATAGDIQSDRALWRSLSAQLRNRTMPPVNSTLSEADRLLVSQWVDAQLRQTACIAGEYAGAAVVRRLNRREYHNTIRDLLGVDFDVIAVFPADGTGGAGFDTNGDTLYIQPMMMERYLQAAQQILDGAIVTPRLSKTFSAPDVTVSIYEDGDYDVRAALESQAAAGRATLQVDGADAGPLAAQRRGPDGSRGGTIIGTRVHLDRGTHVLSLVSQATPPPVVNLSVEERRSEPSAERRALHYRLLGTEPGEQILQPRKAAQHVIAAFLPKAFRRPVGPAAVERFLAMYDRTAERGDPYEERVKLALKAILVSPDFLFRMEDPHPQPGIYPLGQYEIAARLSYFLWSTMPDESLLRLADQGRLQDPAVLASQVERMLDDPRACTFTGTFIGQWLGTQEIGGRFMPILTETLSYFNAEVAADLKMQPVLLFDRIVGENRSVLELLNSDYTYLTRRLVKYYEMEGQVNQ